MTSFTHSITVFNILFRLTSNVFFQGYDPFIKRDPTMAISTSSVSSLASTASMSSLQSIPSRQQRHGNGKVSNTFVKQYKKAHSLSRPKHGSKILPHTFASHYSMMDRIESGV